MVNKIIDTRNLSDKVYDYIIKSIIEGELRFGQIISIREIAIELGVSTMPVREAINRLALENIIKIKPRSNCIIKIPNKKNVLELVELREILEIYSLKKYFNDKLRNDFRNLHDVINEMEKNKKENNNLLKAKKRINLDTLYHSEIVSLAKNENMIKIYKKIILQISMALIYSIVDCPYEEWVYNDHKNIYYYLSINSPKAIMILKKHFAHIRTNIIKSKKFEVSQVE